jgi:hypothetical protein
MHNIAKLVSLALIVAVAPLGVGQHMRNIGKVLSPALVVISTCEKA